MRDSIHLCFVRQWKWFVVLLILISSVVIWQWYTNSRVAYVSEVIVEFRSQGTKTKLNPGLSLKEGFFNQDVRSSAIWYSTLSRSPELINELVLVVQKKLPTLNHSKLRSMMQVEWVRRTAGMILRIEHKDLANSTYIVNEWARVFVSHIAKQRKLEVTQAIKKIKKILKPAAEKLRNLEDQKLVIEKKTIISLPNELVYQKNIAFTKIYSLNDDLNNIYSLIKTFPFYLEKDLTLLNEWKLIFNQFIKQDTIVKRRARWGSRKSRRQIKKNLEELNLEYKKLIKESKDLVDIPVTSITSSLIERVQKLLFFLEPLVLKYNLLYSKIKREDSLYLKRFLVEFFRTKNNRLPLPDLNLVSNMGFSSAPTKKLVSKELAYNLKEGIVTVQKNEIQRKLLLAKTKNIQKQIGTIRALRSTLSRLIDSIEIQNRLVLPLREQINLLFDERSTSAYSARIVSYAYESLSQKKVNINFMKILAVSLIIFLVGFCLLFVRDRYQN